MVKREKGGESYEAVRGDEAQLCGSELLCLQFGEEGKEEEERRSEDSGFRHACMPPYLRQVLLHAALDQVLHVLHLLRGDRRPAHTSSTTTRSGGSLTTVHAAASPCRL